MPGYCGEAARFVRGDVVAGGGGKSKARTLCWLLSIEMNQSSSPSRANASTVAAKPAARIVCCCMECSFVHGMLSLLAIKAPAALASAPLESRGNQRQPE